MSEQLPITETWLAEVGFKWHQFDRQPRKQWLLWLDCACIQPGGPRPFGEDLGIELSRGNYLPYQQEQEPWFHCWLRADTAHRYSRFLHIRDLRYQHELIAMIEGLTGSAWRPEDNMNGCMQLPESAARLRAEHDRLDRRLLLGGHPWREIEKDDTRGGALPEHMEAAVKNGGAQ